MFNLFFKVYPRKRGTNIFDLEWDNLIILDACRYDFFKEEVEKRKLPGKLGYIYSVGTCTLEFMLKTFSGPKEKYKDVVYISANPYASAYLKDKVEVLPAWDYAWDEYFGTALPDAVYEYVLDVLEKYRNKKVIVHFLQPHVPYLTQALNYDKIDANALLGVKKEKIEKIDEQYRRHFFKLVSSPVYYYNDVETQIKGYKENLSIVMDYVEKLLLHLPGRTVITADHGDASGEKIFSFLPFRVYGHPWSIRIDALAKVPWMVVDEEDKEKLRKRKLSSSDF